MNKLPPKVQTELELVNSITDKLGRGVDEGIKLLVAVLHVYGFVTTNSCFGHDDHGFPFVDISSSIAQDFVTSEAYRDLLNQMDTNPNDTELPRKYTTVTREAKFENEKEGLRLLRYIEEYHQQSQSNGIIISRHGGLNANKLQTQKGLFLEIMESEERLKVLSELQQQFDGFTNYLIQKIEQ